MRTNAAQAPVEAKERRNDGLRRYAPLLSGIAVSGALLMPPASGRAETAPIPKRECTASVKSGSIDAFSSPAQAKGVELKIILPAKGKYLLVTLPLDYLEDLGKAAEAKPIAQRDAFSRAAVSANIMLGYDKASGAAAPVRFDCATLSEVAAETKPRALKMDSESGMRMDSEGEKKPAPAPSNPPGKEQPKPEPAKKDEAKPPAPATKPPAPAPAQDAAPEQKRRTLKMDGT